MQRLFDLLTRQYRIRRIRVYFIGCGAIEYPAASDAAFASELMQRLRA